MTSPDDPEAVASFQSYLDTHYDLEPYVIDRTCSVCAVGYRGFAEPDSWCSIACQTKDIAAGRGIPPGWTCESVEFDGDKKVTARWSRDLKRTKDDSSYVWVQEYLGESVDLEFYGQLNTGDADQGQLEFVTDDMTTTVMINNPKPLLVIMKLFDEFIERYYR